MPGFVNRPGKLSTRISANVAHLASRGGVLDIHFTRYPLDQNKVSVAEFSHSCKQVDQSAITYLFEIEAKHDNIQSSLGQDSSRRNVFVTISNNFYDSSSKSIFSSNSGLDINFIIQKIKELSTTRQSARDIVGNQNQTSPYHNDEITKAIGNI